MPIDHPLLECHSFILGVLLEVCYCLTHTELVSYQLLGAQVRGKAMFKFVAPTQHTMAALSTDSVYPHKLCLFSPLAEGVA